MADTRVFKLYFDDESVSYGSLCTAVNTVNSGLFNYAKGQRPKRVPVRVEATNARATTGWIDVTYEFESLRGWNG